MSLKHLTLIMFGIAMGSRSSAKFCTRSYVDGKWISVGDCGGAEMMSEIVRELERRAEEKKWTVFQRRKHGNVDFYRGWDDYVKGFWNPDGDFWLGLDKLHEMTNDGNMELEINMITKDTGIRWVAKYSNFRIGPESDKYRLHLSGFSGNASGDAPTKHMLLQSNNRQFSTKDRPKGNCNSRHEGGWWYAHCGWTNLNGNFNKTGEAGIWWWHGPGYYYFMRFSEMKFRRL